MNNKRIKRMKICTCCLITGCGLRDQKDTLEGRGRVASFSCDSRTSSSQQVRIAAQQHTVQHTGTYNVAIFHHTHTQHQKLTLFNTQK